MRKSGHVSETPATHWLRQQRIPFEAFPYEYVDHGGAREAARQLGLPLHQLAKTLIMEDERGQPLIMLMHGDHEVSTKNLARQIGVKKVSPCTPDTAQRHSGYQVGGTSPFATRKHMPVWIEASLLDFDHVYLNGGRRGFLIRVASKVLAQALGAQAVHVALP
ncbi:aminoacyl-tRNA deacylase [Castellaniella sp.]|uniref:aminoacyl-tRNA deacylase n=1 Tax=Castellaniella sp. TaxID=1955812 RepID=UPI00356AFEA3